MQFTKNTKNVRTFSLHLSKQILTLQNFPLRYNF